MENIMKNMFKETPGWRLGVPQFETPSRLMHLASMAEKLMLSDLRIMAVEDGGKARRWDGLHNGSHYCHLEEWFQSDPCLLWHRIMMYYARFASM